MFSYRKLKLWNWLNVVYANETEESILPLVLIGNHLSLFLFVYLGWWAKWALSRGKKDWAYITDAVGMLVSTLVMAALRSLLLVQEGCRSGDINTISYLHIGVYVTVFYSAHTVFTCADMLGILWLVDSYFFCNIMLW